MSGYSNNVVFYRSCPYTLTTCYQTATMASTIPTDPFDGHSVLFSPFAPNLLAFVGGSNYGIAGAGGLIVLDHGPNGYHEIRR